MKLSDKIVFSGKKIRVHECQMKFGDDEPTYELITFDTTTGVSILPLTDTGVVLIKHYQLGIDGEMWTLPTGGLEDDEDPMNRAQLELREESGFGAKTMKLLCRPHMLPGYVGSIPGYIFVASELYPDPLEGDETFEIEVKEFSWDEVMKMVASGEIYDGRTIIALLYYRQYNEQHE